MTHKTHRKREIERVKLLADIKAGRPHTHRNDILAPLSQADLITYTYPLKGYPAENVKLTIGGEVYLTYMAKYLELTEI